MLKPSLGQKRLAPAAFTEDGEASQGLVQEAARLEISSRSVAATESSSFAHKYQVWEELGKGAFSHVYRCSSRETGEVFAVKVIDLRPLKLRRSFNSSRLLREVEILQDVTHPNIVQLRDVFEEPEALLVVMEYIPGTDLFDAILSRSKFSEDEARPIFAQVTSAVEYLHRQRIVHRDIKPENIKVLAGRADHGGRDPVIKLLDFGLSKHVDDLGSGAHTFVGTPCYLAPEVELIGKGQSASGRYGVEVDCWSLGAVLYVMLVAKFPEFDRQTGVPRIRLEGPHWQHMSRESKDLIRRLMEADPDRRLSAAEALEHPWTTGGLPVTPSTSLDSSQDPASYTRDLPTFQLHDSPLSPATLGGGHSAPPRGGALAVHEPSNPANRQEEDALTRDRSRSRSRSPGGRSRFRPHQLLSPPSSSSSAASSSSSSAAALPPPLSALGQPLPPEKLGHRRGSVSSSSSDVADLDRAGSEETLDVPAPRGGMPSGNATTSSEEGTMTSSVVPHSSSLLGLLHRVQQLLVKCSTIYTSPNISTKIRNCHNLARTQMVETSKVLRKLDQLTEQIVDSVQDLTVAVEECEPALAHNFLERQRQWVIDLRHEMRQVQDASRTLGHHITDLASTIELSYEEAKDQCLAKLDKDLENSKTESERQAEFQAKRELHSAIARKAAARVKPLNVHLSHSIVEKLEATSASDVSLSEDEILNIMLPRVVLPKDGDHCVYFGSMSQECALAMQHTTCPIACLHLLLFQIDAHLESSSILWAQIEVVFDTILRKEDYVAQLVDFTKNPRLMKRFQARLRDYEYFWNSMKRMVVANLSAS